MLNNTCFNPTILYVFNIHVLIVSMLTENYSIFVMYKYRMQPLPFLVLYFYLTENS